MKRLNFIRLLSVFLITTSISTVSNSQNYLGVIHSNYAGIMGADLQPASIVDNRFIVDVNLFSFSVDAWQNAKNFNADVLPKRNWLYSLRKDTAWMDDPDLYENAFSDVTDYNSPNAKSRGIYVNAQLDILNFMFHINPKIAVGLSAKIRFINNVDEINPELGKLAEEGLDFDPLLNKQIDGSLLSQNAMAWAEYGINYAQVISDKGEHFFKAGGRLKFNQGLASSYVHAGDLDFQLLNKDTATTLRGNFNFGYSENIDKYLEDQQNGGVDFSFNEFYQLTSKLGLGLDLGFVYEWRPDWKDYKYDMDGETNIWRRDESKYKLRVGASLLDLGGMRFTKTGRSRDFSVDTENLDLQIFEDVETLGQFSSLIDSLIENDPDWTENEDAEETYYMNTPTALSFQVDYNIWKDFYVNATAYMNVNSSTNASNVRAASQYSITPSYDFKWFGLGIPISYHSYGGFRAGLGARLGPLTIGVPDLKTLFPGGNVRGGGIYAGVRVPILYGHPSDIDSDKVSDELDECIDVPGVWTFRGCPDTDEDGIPDATDDCPMEPGLEKFNGCPDMDEDGIMDKEDDCPETPGLKEFNGCPDTDEDGIMDKEDECPDDAGLPEFKGCPDTDNDSIPDFRDACPDVPGPKELNGCPDTDNDGILDFLDGCPETPGPEENNGCPWPDTDGDGILDKDDDCINLVGPKENNGCPYTDTDEDGVPDKDDDCPETKGPVENNGCPEIEEDVQEILKTAFDNLQFETARAKIKEESVISLNELAEVLQKQPEWSLQIAGHTDNVGNAQSNLILSKKRAEAVKEFMMERGIEKERLFVLFFGQTQPVETNDTSEGRQANRRVEMTIIFK
jgi:outer membrane protein OmpA-like peptidoglycan-associated protein